MSATKTLIDIPEDVLTYILKNYCDYPTIQVLRKVCHDLRNFIDDTKPEPIIKTIEIKVNVDHIRFMMHFSDVSEFLKIHYETHLKGCTTHWETAENRNAACLKLTENEDVVTTFCRDFKHVMRHETAPVLEKLSIIFQQGISELEPIAVKFIESFKKMLESRASFLKVETFYMNISEVNQVIPILNLIDPTPLKKIVIEFAEGKVIGIDEIAEIAKLDQWKQSEELVIIGGLLNLECSCTMPAPCQCSSALVQSLTHFLKVRVSLQTLTPRVFCQLKEAFLYPSKLKHIYVHFEGSGSVSEHLFESFGEPFIDIDYLEMERQCWYFKISNNNDQVIFMEMSTYDKDEYLNVKLVEYDDIPQNAVILN